MRFYNYKCPNNHIFEDRVDTNDMADKPCTICNEPAKRQFSMPNVTFKQKPGYSYMDTRSFNHLTGGNSQDRR